MSAIHARGLEIGAILVDSKPESERDKAIHEDRTGGKLPWRPLHTFAEHRIPIYFIESHNSPYTEEIVHNLGIDLLVNAGTPRILRAEILAAPSVGVLNCHPGMLPAFRGCSAVEWAILEDQPVGNSVHFMAEGIDEGPVVWSEVVTFSRFEGYQEIRVKTYRAGFDLMSKSILAIQNGEAAVKQQDINEGKYYPPISDADLETVKTKVANGAFRFQI